MSEFPLYGHRNLCDKQIETITSALAAGGNLPVLMPLYEKMGYLLNEMHEFEQKIAEDNNQPYPAIPSLRRSSRPHRKPAQPSESSPPFTSSSYAEIQSPNPEIQSPDLESIPSDLPERGATERSPIQELVRFVTVSALAQDFDGERRSNEVEYGILIDQSPETYCPFREKNPTYQLLLSTLKSTDPLYLPRLMMWRIYAFGLDVKLQKRLKLGVIETVQEFYQTWSQLRDINGENSLRVKAYGCQFNLSVPQSLEEMKKIWNGGLQLWSAWMNKLQRTFTDAEKSIALAGMPIYTTGAFSRILLLGDLVRAGIVPRPTDNEMAALIRKSDSGAMKGLEVLGCKHGSVDEVADALQLIRHTLKEQLLPSVKGLFYEGKVGVFDVEHILCKVSRKQTRQATKSSFWTGQKEKRKGKGNASEERKEKGKEKRGVKRKRATSKR